MKITTAGTFLNIKDAEDTIAELILRGVSSASISYIYADNLGRVLERDAEEALIRDKKDLFKVAVVHARGKTLAGTTAGALAGLAAVSAVVHDIGALFIGGPLAALFGLGGAAKAAEAGIVTRVATNTIVEALTGLGINEPDARRYEEWIKKGDIVVCATTETEEVRDIFEDNNAENIRERTEGAIAFAEYDQ